MLTLAEIRWCAAECKRQHSGEMSVSWMCDALDYARANSKWVGSSSVGGGQFPSEFVRNIAAYVEPYENRSGYRTLPVVLPSSPIALPAYDSNLYDVIINKLFEAGATHVLTPTELYKEFEKLHPFIDGNGRVGAILYNYWMPGQLQQGSLVTPPELKF